MFGGIGPMEVVLVLAIALIVLGPKKLPEAARSVGKGLREFKESVSGVGDDDDEDDHLLDPKPTKSPR
jgi:sec-independent protein translocase protein TatA